MQIPNRTVYLGGRINGLSYAEATERRTEARRILETLGFSILDPMRKEKVWDGQADDLTHVPAFQPVIDADEADIRNSGYYLCLSGDSPSWGTGIEIGYALYRCHIPVFAVGNTTPASGWLELKATVSPSILEACLEIAVHAYNLPAELIRFWLEGQLAA